MQPVAALTSAAERSSSAVTCVGASDGRAAMSSAAAAETCAAAYDVPSAVAELGRPAAASSPGRAQAGRFAVSARGSVETIPTPGAAMSL